METQTIIENSKLSCGTLGTTGAGLISFPNPFSSSCILNFKLNQAGKADIIIETMLGQIVQSIPLGILREGVHSQEIRLPDELAQGIYFIRLQLGEKDLTTKVIKQ